MSEQNRPFEAREGLFIKLDELVVALNNILSLAGVSDKDVPVWRRQIFHAFRKAGDPTKLVREDIEYGEEWPAHVIFLPAGFEE